MSRRSVALWIAWSFALAAPSLGFAEDAPPAAPAPSPDAAADAAAAAAAAASARKRSLDSLKDRVGEWMSTRKASFGQCRTCLGAGQIRGLPGSAYALRKCSKCNGVGKMYLADPSRKLAYELRSPAWRSRPTAREDFTREYKSWRIEDAETRAPKTWKIDRVELVDLAHGLSFVVEGEDSVARERRWIYATEPLTKKDTWFLYEEVADGPWPYVQRPAPPAVAAQPAPKPLPAVDSVPPPASPVSPAPPVAAPSKPTPASQPPAPPAPPKPPPPPPVPLDSAALDALREALTAADVKPVFDGAETVGDAVVLRLQPKGLKSLEALEDAAAKSLVAPARIVLKQCPKATSARIVFLARYADRFGEVSTKPYATFSISREDFDRTRWENLTAGAVVDQFFREDHVYRMQGYTLWWKD